jgi:hypothetical protein
MTIGTVHLTGGFTWAMPFRVDVGVAFHARNVPVLGILQVFFLDGHRDLFPIDSLVYIVRFMTFQAFPIRHAEDQAGSTDCVRPMAICTSRDRPWFCLPQFPSYDFGVDLFDPRMTFCAGAGNVSSRDSGPGIGVRQNLVVSVTIIAGRSNDETLPEQTFTVYALGIVSQDVSLGYVVYPCYGRTFPVAFPAQDRNIHFVGA